VTISYRAVGDTANAELDFQADVGSRSVFGITWGGSTIIEPLETAHALGITAVEDDAAEAPETIRVEAVKVLGATLDKSHAKATATILDNDTLSISINDATITEGSDGTRMVELTVSVIGTQGADITVDYTTTAGTAQPGTDYLPIHGALNLSGNASVLRIPILGDSSVEGDEWFQVVISNPNVGAIARAVATVTIQDDDVLAGA